MSGVGTPVYDALVDDVLQQRRAALDRLAALRLELRRLHDQVGGQCAVCAQSWPCASVQVADALAGTGEPRTAAGLVDAELARRAADAVMEEPPRPAARMPRLGELFDRRRTSRAWDVLLGGRPS